MCADRPDVLPRLLQQVPEALQEKVSHFWQDWLRTSESQPDPLIDPEQLGKIWACSEFVARTMCRSPQLWFELQEQKQLDESISLEDYADELEQLFASLPPANDIALMKALRLYRNKHMLRIAWRDLNNKAPTSETLRNLTELAEACVDCTLEYLYQDQCRQLGTPMDHHGEQQRLIVLGMGKLGGHELNYSSDIDLIFSTEHNVSF